MFLGRGCDESGRGLPLRGDRVRGRGRSGHRADLPLLGLPEHERIVVPGEYRAFGGNVPADARQSQALREDGGERAQGFCAACGTGLFARSAGAEENYTLRVGVITQRASFTATQQIWCRSALPWTAGVAGLERREGQ